MTKTWSTAQDRTLTTSAERSPTRRRRWFSCRWRRISTSKKIIPLYFVIVVALVYRAAYLVHAAHKQSIDPQQSIGPLTERYVLNGRGNGGRWYIPPSWLEAADSRLQHSQLPANASIVDAAELVLGLVLQQSLYLNNTRIPRIVHQTWRTLDARFWSPVVRGSAEEWLRVAHGGEANRLPEMAWFLWDDDGIDALLDRYETPFSSDIHLLPYPVELADVFRVVALRWFGGVYTDIDTIPLKHPDLWVADRDVLPWTDNLSGVTHMFDHETPVYSIPEIAPSSYKRLFRDYVKGTAKQTSSNAHVNTIFGIEADNLPDPDPMYWRMGYSFPVQLTNWASAMAPHHPVANQFMSNLMKNISRHRTDLRAVDPLDITGPPALTVAVQEIAQNHDPAFRWNGLSSRNGDPRGGRSKVAGGDMLILPITGFSPGRGWFHRMGSEGFDHPNARLRHVAAGSWRKPDFKVEFGKFCRVTLGLCRDWKKIPER